MSSQSQIFLVKYNFSLFTVISFHHGGLFCFICTELKHSQTFIQGPVNNLASHLRNIHNVRTSSNKVSGIPLVCSQNGCEETFSYFYNFRYHIQKCMKNWKSVAVEVEEVVIQNQNPPSSANLNLLIDHDTNVMKLLIIFAEFKV